jgi:hypothetical protein
LCFVIELYKKLGIVDSIERVGIKEGEVYFYNIYNVIIIIIDVDSLYGCTHNCLGNYAWVIRYWREIDGLAGRCLSFLGTCKVNLVIETHLRLNEVGLIL